MRTKRIWNRNKNKGKEEINIKKYCTIVLVCLWSKCIAHALISNASSSTSTMQSTISLAKCRLNEWLCVAEPIWFVYIYLAPCLRVSVSSCLSRGFWARIGVIVCLVGSLAWHGLAQSRNCVKPFPTDEKTKAKLKETDREKERGSERVTS